MLKRSKQAPAVESACMSRQPWKALSLLDAEYVGVFILHKRLLTVEFHTFFESLAAPAADRMMNSDICHGSRPEVQQVDAGQSVRFYSATDYRLYPQVGTGSIDKTQLEELQYRNQALRSGLL